MSEGLIVGRGIGIPCIMVVNKFKTEVIIGDTVQEVPNTIINNSISVLICGGGDGGGFGIGVNDATWKGGKGGNGIALFNINIIS